MKAVKQGKIFGTRKTGKSKETCKTGYHKIKRYLDAAAAFILICVTWPLMLAIAIAIKLTDPGPVIFKQKRPGYKCKPFYIYKFRTMRIESDRAIPDVDRITPIGAFLRKTSLDELLQLFNIIAGEMSFIGPRPLLMRYLSHYSAEQNRRHDVLPGITGLAQVCGRNAITWDEKFSYDIDYVDNIGLALDIKILLLTVLSLVKRTGINNSENETMPFFTGTEKK